MTERERLIELILKCDKENDVLSCYNERPKRIQAAEIIADYLLANGVIVPPVKVGQTVYCIRYYKARKPFVKPQDVRSITTFGKGKFVVFTTKEDIWGVMAFATQEEAERELERRKEDGHRTTD